MAYLPDTVSCSMYGRKVFHLKNRAFVLGMDEQRRLQVVLDILDMGRSSHLTVFVPVFPHIIDSFAIHLKNASNPFRCLPILYCICDNNNNAIDSHPDPIMQANGKYGYYHLGWAETGECLSFACIGIGTRVEIITFYLLALLRTESVGIADGNTLYIHVQISWYSICIVALLLHNAHCAQAVQGAHQ